MIRRENESAGLPRRPLLSTFVGNNRQMLVGVRDSLSHLNPQEIANGEGTSPNSPNSNSSASPSSARGSGAAGEISQSTPNLNGTGGSSGSGGSGRSLSRSEYNQSAMASIRESLMGFQVAGGASTPVNHCGGPLPINDVDDLQQVNKQMLQVLLSRGYDEVSERQSLKINISAFVFRRW